MVTPFYEQPILNSPYAAPTRHHALDAEGQPLDEPPLPRRRESKLLTPVPKAKKRGGGKQASLALSAEADVDASGQEYNPTPIVNEIRLLVEAWRRLPNSADWGVTPVTARLLRHWRDPAFTGTRPFFCQVEAVETLIWLTEVANRRQHGAIFAHLEGANAQSNPGLARQACKMATGSGKTTVMAMLIAWQALNAARSDSKRFSEGFLIVAPGITIKDRLRVLLPADSESYYQHRGLVPPDMLADLRGAKIVITNFHAFRRTETMEISKVGRALLQGDGPAPDTLQTEGEMLRDACGELLRMKNVVVINDEAHHCYREKVGDPDEEVASAEEREEAKENKEAARLWISGIEALNRKVGVRAVYDLSATPFFLRGSGYREGTLFPWVVSDFNLMDAIESGIVKLPRVPVSDNLPTGVDMPMFRDLWPHVAKALPKKGAAKSGDLDPHKLPIPLATALTVLYGHYVKVDEECRRAGIAVPPVFIVVCNNTATSKLVYEWIAGFERPNEDGEPVCSHEGHLDLFRNYANFDRMPKPNTLLVDSRALEAGEAMDPAFREAAKAEIEQFRKEFIARTGDIKAAETISAETLLREAMNTVGRIDRLGAGIRCVVSVAMLTEGWDTNTVTHVLGLRAFGTQLLCEQVVGRALRRQSYELNAEGLFNPEYADVFGIPFEFTAAPAVAKPTVPKATTHVRAVKERERLEIRFPRVQGYRVDQPDERVRATFTADSRFEINPSNVGASKVRNEGIVGQGVMMTADVLKTIRPSTIAFHLAKHLLNTHYRDADGQPKLHLFGDIKRVVDEWLASGYLVANDVPLGAITYLQLADAACQRIHLACQAPSAEGKNRMLAVLDTYNPGGSTRHVGFNTSKPVYATSPERCPIKYAVLDSDWEAQLAFVLDHHPKVLAWVKNQGLGFEVPYVDAGVPHVYVPDFLVRVNVGGGEPVTLVLEVKGFRNDAAQMKASTMKTLWVPGVNNLGGWGRWAFAEFRALHEIEGDFDGLLDSLDQSVMA